VIRRGARALLAVGIIIGLVACHSYQSQLKASLTTLNAARDGFTTWDQAHQTQLVANAPSDAEGQSELASYRTRRAPVLAGFQLAYQALATAALSPSDVTVGTVVSTLSELEADLKALGVPLPGGL
jgi:hypothetical protein